jgi:hypothetical protein
MNRWQKIAWYNIVVILATLSITMITVGVLAMKYGFPKALSGLGFLGTLGLLGLSGIIFKQKKGQTDFDERDKMIFYKSIQITYATLWPVLTAACMIPWVIVGPNNSISSNTLPLMLGAIGVSMTLLQSLATLVQYGWGNKGEKS